jgi:hypothetical protein
MISRLCFRQGPSAEPQAASQVAPFTLNESFDFGSWHKTDRACKGPLALETDLCSYA